MAASSALFTLLRLHDTVGPVSSAMTDIGTEGSTGSSERTGTAGRTETTETGFKMADDGIDMVELGELELGGKFPEQDGKMSIKSSSRIV